MLNFQDIILLKIVLFWLDCTSESHGYLATLGHTIIASYDNCIIQYIDIDSFYLIDSDIYHSAAWGSDALVCLGTWCT